MAAIMPGGRGGGGGGNKDIRLKPDMVEGGGG